LVSAAGHFDHAGGQRVSIAWQAVGMIEIMVALPGGVGSTQFTPPITPWSWGV
jgi:hypothetical protein